GLLSGAAGAKPQEDERLHPRLCPSAGLRRAEGFQLTRAEETALNKWQGPRRGGWCVVCPIRPVEVITDLGVHCTVALPAQSRDGRTPLQRTFVYSPS